MAGRVQRRDGVVADRDGAGVGEPLPTYGVPRVLVGPGIFREGRVGMTCGDGGGAGCVVGMPVRHDDLVQAAAARGQNVVEVSEMARLTDAGIDEHGVAAGGREEVRVVARSRHRARVVRGDRDDLHVPPTAGSDASGAAETDGHLVAVDDHRHGAAPLAVPEHALEIAGVLLDVDVVDFNVPPLIVVPGGSRVGSGVLAEDGNHLPILIGV